MDSTAKIIEKSAPKRAPRSKTSATSARKPATKAKPDLQILRIRIRAYEHKILDASVKQVMDVALRHDANIRGPIPLPSEIRKYTVNRSSFVYKNAREQFEMRTHKRLIDIINPNAPLIEALTNLTLPSGVSVDVKML